MAFDNLLVKFKTFVLVHFMYNSAPFQQVLLVALANDCLNYYHSRKYLSSCKCNKYWDINLLQTVDSEFIPLYKIAPNPSFPSP